MPVSQSPSEFRPAPPPSPLRLVFVTTVLMVWLGVALWLFWPMSSPRTSRRLTEHLGQPGWERRDRICAECHPGEFAAHRGSGHSRTLALAKDVKVAHWLDGRGVEDPENEGVRWDFAFRDGHLDVDRKSAGQRERRPIEFAFGSGHNAVTFLNLTDADTEQDRPESVEFRLTYFAHDQVVDITPGQRLASNPTHPTTFGRAFNADETCKCFECHTSRTSKEGPGMLDIASLLPNISCERCHGPAGAHVEAARRGDSDLSLPFGDDRETAEEQMRLCGQCHRLPEFIPAEQIQPDKPVLRRFQPVGLMQSKCYTRSDGNLRCTTCHDPHMRTSRDRRAYEATCRKCHQTASQTTCPTARADGCLDCHMPRRPAGERLLFTDHWIRPPSG